MDIPQAPRVAYQSCVKRPNHVKPERHVRFAESPAISNVVTVIINDIISQRAKLVRKLEEAEARNVQLRKELERQPQFICEFPQPCTLISFQERVKRNYVSLETCNVNTGAGNTSLTCIIRVLNQSYEKSVIVRYTTDEWNTFTDAIASFIPRKSDGWSEQFSSSFSITNVIRQFRSGQRILFAIRFTNGNSVCWDNNGGLNYSVKKI